MNKFGETETWSSFARGTSSCSALIPASSTRRASGGASKKSFYQGLFGQIKLLTTIFGKAMSYHSQQFTKLKALFHISSLMVKHQVYIESCQPSFNIHIGAIWLHNNIFMRNLGHSHNRRANTREHAPLWVVSFNCWFRVMSNRNCLKSLIWFV